MAPVKIFLALLFSYLVVKFLLHGNLHLSRLLFLDLQDLLNRTSEWSNSWQFPSLFLTQILHFDGEGYPKTTYTINDIGVPYEISLAEN